MTLKTCTNCKEEKDVGDFYKRKSGKGVFPETRCKECSNKTRHERRVRNGYYTRRIEKDPEGFAAYNKKKNEIERERRRDREWVAFYIIRDSKKSDKKAGRETDLDEEFVAKTISEGCIYCGEKNLRMTLDRMDNSIGHIKSNVVPACIRCNIMRGQTSYEEWVVAAKGLVEARENNLLDNWGSKLLDRLKDD